MTKKKLFIVSDIFEAQQALNLYDQNSQIIALNLEVEFFLKKNLGQFKNRLYDFLPLNSARLDLKYLFSNFKIASGWYKDEFYEYIQGRLGYFLSELERSLNFSQNVVSTIKPKLIYCGLSKKYPGSSIVNGSLENDALLLISKEFKIKNEVFVQKEINNSYKSVIGNLIKKLRVRVKQAVNVHAQILIISPSSHLGQMLDMILDLEKSYRVVLLTYDLSLDAKRRLNKLGLKYFEKERLVDKNVTNSAKKLQKILFGKEEWKCFKHPNYKSRLIINRYIQNRIKNIVAEESFDIFKDIVLSEKLLEQLTPNIVLTTTDPDTKVLPYINKAQKLGITTISFQHGSFTVPIDVPKSDYYIVWSKICKNWAIKNYKFDPKKIIIGKSIFHS